MARLCIHGDPKLFDCDHGPCNACPDPWDGTRGKVCDSHTKEPLFRIFNLTTGIIGSVALLDDVLGEAKTLLEDGHNIAVTRCQG